MNITDINNLIYAVATIMTQILNEPNKRSKNRRGVKFLKIRMQKQISSWRKELSIIAETGPGSDNVKLNRKKRKIFKIYRVTKSKEVRDYRPITCLTTMYKTLTGVIAKRISTHLEEQRLLPAEQKDVTLEVKVARIS